MPLDIEAERDQFCRCKHGVQFRAGVEEIRLVGLAPGRRAVKPRDGADHTIVAGVERLQCIRNGAGGIAEISAETQRRAMR